ncbi:MAG: YabP/YqfC family sporulation protein [Eubacteriales bacterium]|nr:YabP/YqfC family sporulation protein [Eubacteriales bacterium]
MKKSKDAKVTDVIKQTLFYNLPQLQFSGNEEVIVEGSKGVLEYSEELIRINTTLGLIAFFGRSLNLRCISSSELIIDGCILKVEFVL